MAKLFGFSIEDPNEKKKKGVIQVAVFRYT